MRKILTAAALLAAMTVGARAADYAFVTAGDTDYYPDTDYSDCYDSGYVYGGMNEIDFDIPTLSYGLSREFLETSLYNPYLSPGVQYGLRPGSGSEPGAAAEVLSAEPGSFTVEYGAGPVPAEPAPEITLDDLLRDDGSIGTVAIPAVGLEAKVYEGATAESMAKGAGHDGSTALWNGNVGLFGHNRGSYPHFRHLKDVDVGDIVTYETEAGKRTYEVTFVGTIAYTDHSYLGDLGDNRITLTTCVADQPSLRLCVQAAEMK